jgi:hypothetical protein
VGWKASVIEFARDQRLLPEAWLYGLSTVLAGSIERPSFLAGQYSMRGWREFFPVLFAVKTPLALWGAVPLAIAVALRRWRRAAPPERRRSLLPWLPFLASAGAVWLTALASNLNIGHRHILGVYPVLFLTAAGLVTLAPGWRITVPIAVLALQATESLAIRPHYLAFFNPLGGGPAQAHRLVVDSSLDWGQALPALRDWLAEHRRPDEPVYLAYFGSAWPPHYGVRPTHFLPAVTIARPPHYAADFAPGLYCVSATTLAEVYSSLRGPWRAAWTAEMTASTTADDRRAELRTARLCKYLQSRPPDAHAGYAILIYRLTAAEIEAALTGPVKGW